MNLSAYIRVSRVGKRQGPTFLSPDMQRDSIRAWAERNGHTIEGEYTDLDQSGGKMKRPEFDRMLGRVRSGDSQGVVVAKVDRFARSLVGALGTLEELRKLDAAFVSVADDIDTSTPTGRLLLRMLLSFAEFELDRIRQNWLEVQADAIVERGIHFGSVPLGYQRERQNGAPLELVPELVPVVREMFQRRATRESYNSLVRWLDKEAPLSDGRWERRKVMRLIGNRAYLGVAFNGDIEKEGAHPAIVSPDLWNAANNVGNIPNNGTKTGDGLLTGLVRCAGCRYSMSRQRSAGRWAFFCKGHYASGECDCRAWSYADTIEKLVTEHLLLWHGGQLRVEGGNRQAVADAEQALGDAESRLEAFAGDDEYRQAFGRDAFLTEAKRRREAVEQAQATLDAALEAQYADSTRVLILEDEWLKLDADMQRSLLREAVETVYVHAGKEPIEQRVWIRWRGEDALERPSRGNRGYQVAPVPWPEHLEAANVPAWAIRAGHPALAKNLVDVGGRRGLLVSEGHVRMVD